VPNAISLCVPVGGIAGLFFIIPICVTMPPLADVITAPGAQALPYIFRVVMGAPGGALGLMFLVLVLTLGCSISITVAASRCTWALARDNAIPGASIWVSCWHPSTRYALQLTLLQFVNYHQNSQ
jgi:amino acid transporter